MKGDICIQASAENPGHSLSFQIRDRTDLRGVPVQGAESLSRCPQPVLHCGLHESVIYWILEDRSECPLSLPDITSHQASAALVADIPGAGQSLQVSLRPISSPQPLWMSLTAGVISEQWGPLKSLWAYHIHLLGKCYGKVPG